MARTHYTTCPLCEAMCGLKLTLEGDRVTDLRGDADDPLSRGHLCPKAAALPDLQSDPDRLRHPIRRTSTGWEPVAWDDALDDIAARIVDLQARHGADAFGSYLGNPTVHNLGAMLFLPELRKVLGSRNRFSATSVDQLPHMLAAYTMFGHQLLMGVPDIDRTQLLVMFGANPAASNGSLWSAPGLVKRLKSLTERGRVVCFDPRRTETADLSTEHHFIRPGTDALVLMAMLHVVLTERGARPGAVAPLLEGLEDLDALVEGFEPERVSGLTGVPADTIRTVALELADTARAVLYGRMGVSTQAFGSLCAWLITVLNAVCGNLDQEGGLMYARPALDTLYPPLGMGGKAGSFRRWASRIRGLPEFGGELPVATLAEEILTPGDGQIRGMLVWAGNPVLSTPNGTQLDEAFASLELMVSVDFYLTETSRHAHYVLPPTGPLARPHYDAAFQLFAVRNTARWSDPAVMAEGDTRQDWEIAVALGRRLDAMRGTSLRKRFSRRMTGWLGPERMVDLALRLGPHKTSVAALRSTPSGVDFGPLVPCLAERLPPGRRVQLVPDLYRSDLPRLRALLDEEPSSLVLIGRRELRSNNSWMHNQKRLVKGRDRCVVLVHPDDAAHRSLADGQEVELTSRVGTVRLPVHITDAMMPGVVSVPHGYGHDREGASLSVASEVPGPSVNDLTDERLVDPVSGNAVLNGVPVTLCGASPA